MQLHIILFAVALFSAIFAAYNFNRLESTESRYQQLTFFNSSSPEVSSLKKVVTTSNILGGISVLIAQTCLLIGLFIAINAAS